MNRILDRVSPAQRSLIAASFAFIFYGAWAYWVNSLHGTALALKAGVVQGGYSFVLTFSMTLIIERLYLILLNALNNYLLVVWLTITLTCTVIFGTSWGIHVLAGTPEIFETVLLGYVLGSIYSIAYVYGLARIRNEEMA